MKSNNKQVTNRVLPNLLYIISVSVLLAGCESIPFISPNAGKYDETILKSRAFLIIDQALHDPNPAIRSNAIEVITNTNQSNLVSRILPLLADESPMVRFAAAIAVGDMGYAPAINSINSLLNDENTNVVIAASYARYKLGSPEFIQAIKAGLADEQVTVRANAALLLGKTGDLSSLAGLHETINNLDSEEIVIYQAAEAIAKLGDESIYEKLWTMLISSFADIRVMGTRAMGSLGTMDAKYSILQMLDDSVLEVRIVAAEQLGKFGDNSGESVVLEVFQKNLTKNMQNDAKERVNTLSALAIGQICTQKLKTFLPELLENESKSVQLAAAQAVLYCSSRTNTY